METTNKNDRVPPNTTCCRTAYCPGKPVAQLHGFCATCWYDYLTQSERQTCYNLWAQYKDGHLNVIAYHAAIDGLSWKARKRRLRLYPNSLPT